MLLSARLFVARCRNITQSWQNVENVSLLKIVTLSVYPFLVKMLGRISIVEADAYPNPFGK